MREAAVPAASYGDLALVGDGRLVQVRGEVVALPEPELQLVASLVRAQGRAVRRTVLELKAWGIWQTVSPGALAGAIQRLRAQLAMLGSGVGISGSPELGYALTRS
ncbi:helix-turn-helix domain-containing protein [Caenimonas terrae]|uniref:Helix-turn-helix domain-containing protein n=1 Tax=Caenimonas terrae TaxID=696074 RepID=A0ABW0NH21_9BURK